MAASGSNTSIGTSLINEFPDLNRSENKEGISIVWYDREIGTRLSDTNHVRRLSEINDYVRVFTNQEICLNYIQSAEYERIILITSGSDASNFLLHVNFLKQVDSIFIFCFDKNKYTRLKNSFTKIVDIYVNFELFLKAVEEELTNVNNQLQAFAILDHCQQSMRVLSKESAEFIWFQLSKHVIMHLPRNESSKSEMLTICRQYYRNNSRELTRIDQFERSYKPDDAIRWYTKQSFIYKLVNQALRREDIALLRKFRFFIIDLSSRLANEHRKMLETNISTLTLYRGTNLSKKELEKFSINVGQLIATNGFWSTSRSRGRALLFAKKSSRPSDILSVLFEIKCNVKENGKNAVFADISTLGEHPIEEEVLFDLSTCFRIDGVHEDKDVTVINLSLSNDGQSEAQKFFKEKRNEIENENLELMLGILMCEMGQYRKAQNYFEQLLTDHKDDELAWIELNIGRALYYQGELVDARKYYDKAYERMMSVHPPRIKDSAAVLNNIGVLLQDQGNLIEAEKFHQKALEIRKDNLKPDHIDIRCSLTNIGNILDQQGKYGEALEYHRRVLEINQHFSTVDGLDCAVSLNNIGNILIHLGKYDEALDSHQHVLRIRKNILSSRHPDTACSYNNIGETLHRQGKYNEALEFHYKALEIREKCFRENNSKIADSLNNIGSVLQGQKKNEKAIEYHRRALQMRETCLPPDHPDIAYSLNDIGSIRTKQGKYEEARALCEKALNIQKKHQTIPPCDIASCYNNIGIIMMKQEEHKKALNNFNSALEIQKQYLPQNHPNIADSLNNIGLIYQHEQHFSKAVDHFQRSLRIKEESLSPDHPSLVIHLQNMGYTLRLQEKYTECLDCYIRAYQLQVKHSPPNDPDVADTLYNMGIVYAQLKQTGRALAALKQASELYKDLPNETERWNRIQVHLQKLTTTES